MNQDDIWEKYRQFTHARIGLGRTGSSMTTRQMLAFRTDHALASDAVWADLNTDAVQAELQNLGLDSILLNSQARDRQQYVQRPDLGRILSESSQATLQSLPREEYEVSITLADGLSAIAIERNAAPLLAHLMPLLRPYRVAPITIVRQGRVAISDPIGDLLGSQLSVILIGERPGLTSPYSMGAYLTYAPCSGNTDERRNCISNIRSEGLPHELAAQKLCFLIGESLRKKLSGVKLKDLFHDDRLNDAAQ
ncbi:ethanolamine ammonia-lyase subunit EutC [Blastopirellula sp. JC732]|uniref:Ethanolamine ammonia-lyase small subunit n=1 Tax=Blastopirellula sediminis TaxID=2894196 RepID=A0A9X1MNV6_9BACT|nr:ethanolamine ammonia-lyase subunit EutC [Blastopirellula sediminis]MCC9607062.1 ethanolamine ammonia-lyase subunit EutC [Blastopirellula sediminis]MCC9629645.1 ethanolamine ammonia-lyase subunit EutC [Blastopirellula sediminis]